MLLKKSIPNIIFKMLQVISKQYQYLMHYGNHDKAKARNWYFYIFQEICFLHSFLFLLIYIFFIWIKLSKNLSAKYYQENKERPQKKARKRYQNLSEEEKNQ